MLAVAVFSLAVLALGGSAQAASITMELDIEFSGGDEPESATTPWVTATFDDAADAGGANSVQLTMSGVNLFDVEAIQNFHFNFDPSLDPTALSFSVVGIPGSVPNSINTGVNAFMADGDGNFDIQFLFPPPPGGFPDRFTMGETVVYDITYTSAIDVNDFYFFSEMGGGAGSYLAAAQILSIGPADTGSGWIGAVPEPATALLLGSGLVGLAAARRRRSL